MEKMYFIIRVKEWCCGCYYGTFQELETVLAKFGAEITGEEKCQFKRIGLEFNKRITTSTKVYGTDKKLRNEILSDILEVFKKHGMEISEGTIRDSYNFNRLVTVNSVFDTDLLDVLVSDGVFHPKKNCGYIGIYESYRPLSEFSEEFTWRTFGSICGFSNPKLID